MSTEKPEKAPRTKAKEAKPRVEFPIPKGVKVHLDGETLVVEGSMGKAKRKFPTSVISIDGKKDPGTLTLLLKERKRTHSLLLSWERHLNNLTTGVTKGFEAKAKVVAAHFPMKVYTKDSYVMIENFLGEKHPRRALIVGSTKVEVKGEELIFVGCDVEDVGQSVANLERATHIRNYDPRVFQDGIYVTIKAHPREG
jgi:large subunit ribosomal protein L6